MTVAHNRYTSEFNSHYFDSFPADQWVYLSVVYDNGIVTVYFDGNEIGSSSIPLATNPGNSDLYFGFAKLVKTALPDYEKFVREYDEKVTEKGKFTEIVKSSVDEITGMNSSLTTTGGTSDARFFKDYCEVAEFGLIGETAHQIDENVKTEDITKLKEIYSLIILSLIHISEPTRPERIGVGRVGW